MKRILLANAYESWMDAIDYAELLHDGVCTLGYKKKFVSALHNAVELFMKQIMLDNCDYRIASYKRVGSDGEPLKSFLASKDLNKYFLELDPKVRSKFYTIEFSELIEICKKEKLLSIEAVGDSLKVLNSLRNNEMHFYVSNDDYLCESDFCKLYNFMIDLYHELKKKRIFSWLGRPSRSSDKSRLCFDKTKLKTFSFLCAIQQSAITKKLASLIENHKAYFFDVYSGFQVTNYYWDMIKNEMQSFERTVAYIDSLFIVGAIKITPVYLEDIQAEYESLPTYYDVKIKTMD